MIIILLSHIQDKLIKNNLIKNNKRSRLKYWEHLGLKTKKNYWRNLK